MTFDQQLARVDSFNSNLKESAIAILYDLRDADLLPDAINETENTILFEWVGYQAIELCEDCIVHTIDDRGVHVRFIEADEIVDVVETNL